MRHKMEASDVGFSGPYGELHKNMVECAKRTAKPRRSPKDPLTPEMLWSMYERIGGESADLIDLRKLRAVKALRKICAI